MINTSVLSMVPPEIWNMLDGYLLNSNLIIFLIQNENKINLQLDKWKLEYLWKRKNPKIIWIDPSMYYPNVRLGYNYIEYKTLKDKQKNHFQTKIEYLPNVIVQKL